MHRSLIRKKAEGAVRFQPVRAQMSDPYSTLGVKKDATAAQIKQAYRRLALRCHPDVNKAPDAQETFAKVAEAYATLSDPEKRRKYDARSPFSGFDGGRSPPSGASRPGPSYQSSAASRAAAAERGRRWREENPTPEELGDSFGALFSDLVGAVSKVVGGGDWISLLEELTSIDAWQMDSILRSSDPDLLADELESAQFVQTALKSRIQRLATEAKAAQAELDEWDRNWRMRDLDRPARSGMGMAYGDQLKKDVARRKGQLADARRLLTQAEQREQLIKQRLEVVRSGGGRPGPREGGSRSSQTRQLPSVEDELQRIKREMGK